MAERITASSAEDFLIEVKRETGVSDQFVEAARPAVEKLFAQVPPEARAPCMETVRGIFARQAETERVIGQAQDALRRLREDLGCLFTKMRVLKEQSESLLMAARAFKQPAQATPAAAPSSQAQSQAQSEAQSPEQAPAANEDAEYLVLRLRAKKMLN